MSGNIWIVAEQWRGKLSEITFESLALGREVADGLGVKLQAVLLGHDVQNLSTSLGMADSVIYVDHTELADPGASAQASALAQLVRQQKPRAVIVPLTNVSLGTGTLLGEQVGAPVVNFCKDLRAADGHIVADCVLYGGKIEATVTPRGDLTVIGLWPGSRPPDKGRSDRNPPVETQTVTFADQPSVKLRSYIEPDASDVDITQQDVLVAVGRGIQSQENVALAEELAASLGGAVCGSRPVIDQGWLPLSRQVGKSGLNVKPKLYLALGISGAPEHLEGMKDAPLIVAVNSDPDAPIFNVAHYGVVADAMDMIPTLKETVLALRG